MEEAAGETVIELKLAAATVIFMLAKPWTVPDFAVMVTDPLATPVAIPLALMVAIAVSDELQTTVPLTSLLLPSENLPMAVNCWVAPAPIAIVPGDTCKLLKEAGVGEGVGAGVGVGVGPPEMELPVELPPPPHPLNSTLNKTKAAKIDLTFTLVSRPMQGIRQNFEKGENVSLEGKSWGEAAPRIGVLGVQYWYMSESTCTVSKSNVTLGQCQLIFLKFLLIC
jgi:hypothetical protein